MAQLELASAVASGDDERETPTTPVFARHDTFHPRFGWIRKGYMTALADPSAFLQEDAAVELGVGKNMVRAIRHWCHAFGVLRDAPAPEGRSNLSVPTNLGRLLFGSTPHSEEGLDPFLEDLGSLWLLHWSLLRDGGAATAWRFAFFHFAATDFTVDELTSALESHVAREFIGARYALSSLKKDASCLVRMYGELPRGGLVSEESIHCPFAELGLMRPTKDRKTYAFQTGTKAGLSNELITAACLEFAARRHRSARTVALSALARDIGSPGLSFRLTEGNLYAALEEVTADEPGLEIKEAGGVIQLVFDGAASDFAHRMALKHFDRAVRGVV
jgi:hypothetical protein